MNPPSSSVGPLAVAWAALFVAAPVAAAQPAPPPVADATPPPAWQVVATGLELARGIAIDAQGNLLAANYRRLGWIGQISPVRGARVVARLDELAPDAGRPSVVGGLALDSEGRLLVVDAGAGRLLRVATDGSSAEVLADRFEGRRFHSLAFVAVDRAGHIYFTDRGDAAAAEPSGAVYRFDVVTRRVARLVSGAAGPTGLAIVGAPPRLFFAETQSPQIRVVPLTGDAPAEPETWLVLPAAMPGEPRILPGGLAADGDGALYLALGSSGDVAIIAPTGELLRRVSLAAAGATDVRLHAGRLIVAAEEGEGVFALPWPKAP